MIRKILIANRGEIACRIIRTCREMGIFTVVVFSDADQKALHVSVADEAVYIGASPATESYLNIDKIIYDAEATGCDAIHPGYGFLAENSNFAQAVVDAGIIFIGPTPEVIALMGDKREAKLHLKNVPFVPGYIGEDQSNEVFVSAANDIGFPVMVKATAGGGGKGMRAVYSLDELTDALVGARREAEQAFGNPTLMLEKLIQNPRHVEVQILGDLSGEIRVLGERECTIQRRHQKIIEESPSTALTLEKRQQMWETARSIGEQIRYTNAGTIEFLVDENGDFYFMEMNTRLQVEHPVTEAVFEEDLVRWQIEIAEGRLFDDTDLSPLYSKGHAIEARIYAEDPMNDFLPVTGKILRWHLPDNVDIRLDSGVQTDNQVTVHYDPMLAKMIAHGVTRQEAIRKLDHGLSKLQLLGFQNNIAFLRKVLTHPHHLDGNFSTGFIDQHPELLTASTELPTSILIACVLAREDGSTFWRNNPNHPITHQFLYGEHEYTVALTPLRDTIHVQINEDVFEATINFHNGEEYHLIINGYLEKLTIVCSDGIHYWAHSKDGTYHIKWIDPLPLPVYQKRAEGSLKAPMPGQIIRRLVNVGQTVTEGDVLIIMEAMKMEHRITAPTSGKIEAIHYDAGDTVNADDVLLELNPTLSNA